ncbi:MAG: NAD(P)-dependent alcohol dehydrogenase [Candidatus Thorarchaeota archaeon]
MKAIITRRYGSPERLRLEDVKKPIPKDNEVLIRVHAASLNAADFEIQRGALTARFTGPLRPKHRIPGSDVAGVIEDTGTNATKFQPGDSVMGDLFTSGFGAFAEYVCAPENVLTMKPSKMTFEEAATYPQAAIIALQALRGKRQIMAGEKVLINGAGGGMGTFAVQIAKHYGAEVTGVDSARKLDLLQSIGCDHVIDYTKEEYTKSNQCYDVILDTVARHSISEYERVLYPGGLFVMVGGSRKAIFQAVFLGPRISGKVNKHLGLNLWGDAYNQEDMDFLEGLYDSGEVVPVIDRCCPLAKLPAALKYLEDGLALGKVAISMEDNI